MPRGGSENQLAEIANQLGEMWNLSDLPEIGAIEIPHPFVEMTKTLIGTGSYVYSSEHWVDLNGQISFDLTVE